MLPQVRPLAGLRACWPRCCSADGSQPPYATCCSVRPKHGSHGRIALCANSSIPAPLTFFPLPCAAGALVGELTDPNLTTICPVNKPHPRRDLIVSGSSRSLYVWHPGPGQAPCRQPLLLLCTSSVHGLSCHWAPATAAGPLNKTMWCCELGRPCTPLVSIASTLALCSAADEDEDEGLGEQEQQEERRRGGASASSSGGGGGSWGGLGGWDLPHGLQVRSDEMRHHYVYQAPVFVLVLQWRLPRLACRRCACWGTLWSSSALHLPGSI